MQPAHRTADPYADTDVIDERAPRTNQSIVFRLRGISARHHDRIDPADLDGFPAVHRTIVQFTHPVCSDCREWDQWLESEGAPRVRIDVRESPGLAEKYGIAVVPTIFAVDREGAVIEQLA